MCVPHILERRTKLTGSVAAADSAMAMSPFADAGAMAPGQVQDFPKLYKAEVEHLAFASGQYKWIGDDIEDKILRKYGKLS